MQNKHSVAQLVEDTRSSLQKGEIAEALALARRAIAVDVEHPPAVFLLGVALRLNGFQTEAIHQLTAFIALQPNVPQGHYELGLAHYANDQLAPAESALRRAVRLDAGFVSAWRMLSEILITKGDEDGAAQAHARTHLAKDVDPALKQASELFASGRIGVAEGICREYLRLHPTDVNAIRLLADIGYKLGLMKEAVQLYERCLTLAPDYTMARHKYALALSKQDKFDAAMTQVNQLLKLDDNNIGYKTLHAAVASSAGRYDEAHKIYEDVIARIPDDVSILTSYGHSLRYAGLGDRAAEIYRQAIASDPKHGDAYWSLANLKTVNFTQTEVSAMTEQLAAQRSDSADKYHLAFALGKAREDLKDFQGSFQAYQLGNKIKHQFSGYDANDNTGRVDNIISVCNAPFMSVFDTGGHQDNSPIFILGLPRSGSTLLEQILASHSEVEATAELHFISRIAAQLEGSRKRGDERRYPKLLADLSEAERVDLGQQYLDACAVHRKGAKRFIDKLPNNFMHLPLIRAILPNASIVDARRAPMAACFANFKQLFAEGQAFTYSLEDIGRYYVDYRRLMEHFDEVSPGYSLTVHYEEVVNDLETQVARLLHHCDLPFEQQCVSFYENKRAVRSASSEQVRQPIFQSGLNQWRHYEQWLDPLKQALGVYYQNPEPTGE
jgi:tetratricopeptide (TPR) repeat protein